MLRTTKVKGAIRMAKPDGPVGVFVAAFDTEEQADKALEAIKFLEERTLMIDVFDHAKAVRHPDGKVEIRHASDAKSGAKKGLIAGAVFGVIFPPSIIVTGAVAAAGGAAYEKMRNKSVFGKGNLQDAAEMMKPGRSAIVVITNPQHLETLKETVPSAVATASQVFESLDAEAIREWIDTLPGEVQAREAAAAAQAESQAETQSS
jgi:uncharacterized membrane protein